MTNIFNILAIVTDNAKNSPNINYIIIGLIIIVIILIGATLFASSDKED